MRIERIGDAVLYLADCRSLDLKCAQSDLLLTDPPYGVDLNPANALKSRGFRPYDSKARAVDFAPVIGDNEPFNPAHLLHFRNAVLWGANNYASKLPDSSCWFNWDRKAGKAADSDITDCELAWVRGLPFKTVRKFSHMWAGFQRDSEVGQKHLHPTQKPVALFNWCLSFFPKAETVFDLYMGSGACGVAAIQEGRSFVGAELDPEHFETACNRIADAVRNPPLFIHTPPAPKPINAELFP